MALRQRPRQSFGFRLFLGVALTLLAAGAGSYTVTDRQVRAELLRTAERDLRGEIGEFEETVGRRATGPASVEMRAFARRLSRDERFTTIVVLDEQRRVIYGARQVVYGSGRERRDKPLLDAPARVAESVITNGRAFTLVADHNTERFDVILQAARDSLLVIALPAILLSLGLFWLLAGRSLHVRHKYAIQRASRDGLTGLANHRSFQDELQRATALSTRSGMPMALAVLDVDDFKFLNDRRGHVQGDEVLRRVARVLGSGREGDVAFRTGGDEFALIMPATNDYDGFTAASRLCKTLADARIAVSCGVSATRTGMTAPAVLREEAEAALQEAKRCRAEGPVRFSDVSGRAMILSPEKIHAVRLLISEGALDVALQPIWDLDEGTLIGCEGLARPHSDYGLTGPSEAFDIAEQIGHIADLDRLCMSRLVQRAAHLPAGARLFVNVHPASLDDHEEGMWLLQALALAGVPADRVVVEVTERGGARIASLIRVVDRLRSLGLKVALDDVGAGNSGLELLHRVPVDYVKIDREIVTRAPVDSSARGVLAAISAFATETGTFVIAEGIENADSLQFLRAVAGGIRGGQGYGLGRPATSLDEALCGGALASHSAPAVERELRELAARGSGDSRVAGQR